MGILANSGIIWTYDLNPNQSDVVAHVVDKIFRRLFFGAGWQFVVIHLPSMLPVHAKDKRVPHMVTMPYARRLFDPQIFAEEEAKMKRKKFVRLQNQLDPNPRLARLSFSRGLTGGG